MIFKIVFNNEIYRVAKTVDSFDALYNVISERFLERLPEKFIVEYKDTDGDMIRISTEEDF